jgi:hypothetical protein
MGDVSQLNGYQLLVFAGVGEGLTNNQIRDREGGSVPNEVRRIMYLLNIRSRLQLALYWIELNVEADSEMASDAFELVMARLSEPERALLGELHQICVMHEVADIGDLMPLLRNRIGYIEQLKQDEHNKQLLALLRRVNGPVYLSDALNAIAKKLGVPREPGMAIVGTIRFYHLAAMYTLTRQGADGD